MATRKEGSTTERRATPRKTATAVSKGNDTTNAKGKVSPDEMRRLIEITAYFRAKARGFEPGHELDDWVQAEAEVARRLGTQ